MNVQITVDRRPPEGVPILAKSGHAMSPPRVACDASRRMEVRPLPRRRGLERVAAFVGGRWRALSLDPSAVARSGHDYARACALRDLVAADAVRS